MHRHSIPFFRQLKRKKTVRVLKRKKKQWIGASGSAIRQVEPDEEIVIEQGSNGLSVLEQEMSNDNVGDGHSLDGTDATANIEINEAKDAHDNEVITSVRILAIDALKEWGVTMTGKEEESALGLFPKVKPADFLVMRVGL